MSKLVVQSCKFKREFQIPDKANPNTTITLRSYAVMGLLDGELDSVEMTAQSDLTAPKVGETIEVTVEETQYGKKAKKVRQNTFQGPSRSAQPEDPAREARIVRQNSVTNSIVLLSAIATIEKKTDNLTVENVLVVAAKLAAYSMGEQLPPPSVVDVVKNTPPQYEDDDPGPDRPF